jgi:hypothetical protein
VSEAMRKRNKIEAGKRKRLALAITSACSVALSGGVIASLIYLLLALASLMAARPAFAQAAPVGAGVRLEAGIEKEDVDFSVTALGFDAKAGRPGILAVVKNDGTGHRELFQDDSQGTVLSGGTIGFDWSWDNRFLLLWAQQKVGGRVYIISLADGQRRELARTENGYISRVVFCRTVVSLHMR